MDKIKLKYFVDIGLLITFIISFATGIIKFPGIISGKACCHFIR